MRNNYRRIYIQYHPVLCPYPVQETAVGVGGEGHDPVYVHDDVVGGECLCNY